jgi:PAS domain S-box-containing protein
VRHCLSVVDECEDTSPRDALDAEATYESLFAQTPAMMHSIDRSGRIVRVSDMWLEVMGYTREEVVGRPSVEFLAPESRHCAIETVLPAVFATGEGFRDVPCQFVKKSGEILDVLLSCAVERDPEGRFMRTLAVLNDVTERKRAEAERDRLLEEAKAARDAAERAAATVDTLLMGSPVAVGLLDRELRYVRVNGALARLHGRTPEEDVGRFVGDALADAHAPDWREKIVACVRGVLETGQPLTHVVYSGPIPSRPEETGWWVASYYPVRCAHGEVIGVGVIICDVTEERRAAETQARLCCQAQEALRVREDFLAIAAHELLTPLTPLALRLQAMERKLARDEAVDVTTVRKALRQLDHLTTLISELVDASRIEAGRLTLHRTPTSLNVVLREQTESMSDAHHPIELDEGGDELIVFGDRPRLAQIVVNLLDNAVKYSDGAVRVSLRRCDGTAELSVSDSGIGIPEDQRPKLFERFFRARNAPTSSYGGLGLGLYITRDIVERHGGRIWVESEIGKGTTFHVALPLHASAERLSAGKPRHFLRRRSGRTPSSRARQRGR